MCLVGSQDGSFTIHGMADLEDVCTSLAFQQVNEDDLKEFGTLSGYLCSQAGEIPAVGDYVVVGGYMFTVTKVWFFNALVTLRVPVIAVVGKCVLSGGCSVHGFDILKKRGLLS